jgi:hypothetical protein
MPAPTVPVTTFVPTNTIIPAKAWLVITGGSTSPTTLIGKVADYTSNIETVERDVPQANGALMPDRVTPKKQVDGIKFETEDVLAIAAIFGSVSNAFLTGAGVTAELFVRDPEDAALTIALHAAPFACDIKLEGGLNLKGGEVTKATVIVNAHVPIVIMGDVTTSN